MKQNYFLTSIYIFINFVKYSGLKNNYNICKSIGNTNFFTMFGSSLLLCPAITSERNVQFQWNNQTLLF